MAKTRTRAKPAARGYAPAVPLRLVDDAVAYLEIDIDRGRLTAREVFEQMRPMVECAEAAESRRLETERDEMEAERDEAKEAADEYRQEAADADAAATGWRDALGAVLDHLRELAEAGDLAGIAAALDRYGTPHGDDPDTFTSRAELQTS